MESKCCCPHPDARACLLARYPELRRRDDSDTRYDATIDEQCECACHRDDEPVDWEGDNR